jgi:hypothetical protein
MNDSLQNLDELLARLSELLTPVQNNLPLDPGPTRHPLCFVIGTPRSGTTLSTQLLASTSWFSYPSNFLARFACAPYLGALIQKMLFEKKYDPEGIFTAVQQNCTFESRLGKTYTAVDINEFNHFWRRFFYFRYPRHLCPDELASINVKQLQSDMRSLERAFGKPFVCKGIALQYNLDFFSTCFPNAVFLWVRRHPFYVMQSILIAREKIFSDCSRWWSTQPPEYSELKKQPVHAQIAGQVFYTEQAIKRSFEHIPTKQKCYIRYEELCRAPRDFLRYIAVLYKKLGTALGSPYSHFPESLQITNEVRIERKKQEKLLRAWHDISGEDISL